MEKEQILSTINEQLGETNFSERTISDYVDAFIPETEENPDFAKHVGFLKSLYGNFSADVARQVNEAKAKLQPAPAPREQPGDTRYADLEAKFDKLMESHEKLAETLAQKESRQTQEQLMSQVKSEMKRQGASDDYVLRQTLRGVTLNTGKSVADLTKELMEKYDSEYSDCRGSGAAPRSGNAAGGGKGKTSADTYWEKKNRRKALAKK